MAPFEFDQPGRALAAGGLADGVDHRIARGQRIAARDGEHRREAIGEHRRFGFQLSGAEVGRADIDEIAHLGGGLGEPHGLVDPRGVAGEEDAWSLRLACLVAFEPVLTEQPAEPRRANVAVAQPIGPLGQDLALRRNPPRRAFGFVAYQQRRPVIGRIAGQDGAIARLAADLLRANHRADARRLRAQPIGKAIGVDDIDRARGLAAIGLEEGGEVGHSAGITRNCSNRPGASDSL